MKILIAAATSNSGKTTFTMGLLRALRNRGLSVQPYKCGPDYIDPMFHHLASGNESVNLDTFMSSHEHVRQVFGHYGAEADCQVVEGVMGMFDGYDRWHGSSADVAMLLDIPVLLLVNAKSAAYSVAPLIQGFRNFTVQTPDGLRHPRLAGVIFNMVASENHYAFLKAACDDAGVPCLGYLSRNERLAMPGRHLGLTISAREEMEQFIALAAEEVEKHVDLEYFISEERRRKKEESEYPDVTSKPRNTIAVANDEAFNFTYRANIDALRKHGNVTFFSPLRDKELPQCDFLYLPGGYPELFADELSSNATMRESILRFAENDGHVFAECGGFMYLCKDIDGKAMCGVFPMSATMQGARLHLGYRQVSPDAPIAIGNLPLHASRGHEFHYSHIMEDTIPDSLAVSRCQQSAKGAAVPTAIYSYRNVTAGYTHWYWGEGDCRCEEKCRRDRRIMFVSLGPGGRNNLTLGAYDSMVAADKIYCFGSNGKSYARDIMLSADIDERKISVIDIPMSNDRTAAYRVYDNLVERIKQEDSNIVVATEGDTGIFATTHYVMERLAADGFPVQQTAGVPSFIAAGAMAGISLVSQHQRLLVVPGEITAEEMEQLIGNGTTIVIMKLSRMTALLHSFIHEHPDYEYHYTEKVGTPHARHITDTDVLEQMEYPYFSIMIVKRKN